MDFAPYVADLAHLLPFEVVDLGTWHRWRQAEEDGSIQVDIGGVVSFQGVVPSSYKGVKV